MFTGSHPLSQYYINRVTTQDVILDPLPLSAQGEEARDLLNNLFSAPQTSEGTGKVCAQEQTPGPGSSNCPGQGSLQTRTSLKTRLVRL